MIPQKPHKANDIGKTEISEIEFILPMLPTRVFFLLIAAGFSYSVLLTKLPTLLVYSSNQIINVVVFIAWLVYIIAQTLLVWDSINAGSLLASSKMIGLSTMFYNVAICSILFMSMNRILDIYKVGRLPKVTKLLIYPLVGILFGLRTVRSVLIISNPEPNFSSPVNVLHAATLFPILAFHNAYEFFGLNAVVKMKATNEFGPEKIKLLVLNISIEVILSILSLGIIILEAFTVYENLVYIDWLLISWALGCDIEQRQIYQRLSRRNVLNEITGDRSSFVSQSTLKASEL